MRVKKLRPDAKLPTRGSDGAAGFDLYSCEAIKLYPHQPLLISTGIAIEIPLGYVGLIWDRSSMGKRGIKVCGGVIDSDYRGQVGVVLVNCSGSLYVAEAGARIAQIIIQKCETPDIEEAAELSGTSRGDGAWGSTGQ